MQIRNGTPQDVPRICRLYQAAFSAPPWFESITDEEISARWTKQTSYEGFMSYVMENDGCIVGATWLVAPSDDALRRMRGAPLVDYLRLLDATSQFVYIQETVVDPKHMGRGIASKLKTAALAAIKDTYGTAVVVTCMRDNNVAIVRTNESFGFLRTGIKKPYSKDARVELEYWYRILA